jgi:hypothetical protein
MQAHRAGGHLGIPLLTRRQDRVQDVCKMLGAPPPPPEGAPPRTLSLFRVGPSRGLAREHKSDAFTPHAKTRAALERKATSGDVQAARELREHESYWYPNAAAHGDWMAALSKVQREVRTIIAKALSGDATGLTVEELDNEPPLSHR